MSIDNEKLYEVLLDIKGDIGGLRQGLDDTQAHVLAVSDKAGKVRSDLDAHKESPNAHRGAIMGAVYAMIGAAGAALALWQKGHGGIH